MIRNPTRVVLAAALLALTACGDDTPSAEDLRPRAETGLVATTDEPLQDLGEGAVDPADGRLITPHTAQRVVHTWSTDELPADIARAFVVDRDLRPGEEQEFLLVELGTDGVAPTYPADAGTSATVVVDGAASPLPPSFGTLEQREGPGGTTLSLLLSVPVDGPVLYSVTDAGRTASIDLRTGERSDDEGTRATDPYYRPHTESVDDQASLEGVLSGPTASDSSRVSGLVTREPGRPAFSLEPFDPGRGWAPPGRLWGVAQVQVGVAFPTTPTLTLDPAQVFTLTPAGGAPLPAAGAPGSVRPAPPGTASPVVVRGSWDLPADFTTGTLETVVGGTWRLGDAEYGYSAGGPVPLPPLAIDLTR